MPPIKINLARKFSQFHWSPKIASGINDNYVKLVKSKDEFILHLASPRGRRRNVSGDGAVWMNPGEFCIVPRGVSTCRSSQKRCMSLHVVLFEPRSTLNTGNVRNARTLEQLGRV